APHTRTSAPVSTPPHVGHRRTITLPAVLAGRGGDFESVRKGADIVPPTVGFQRRHCSSDPPQRAEPKGKRKQLTVSRRPRRRRSVPPSNDVARDLVRRAGAYDINRIRFRNPFIPLLRFTVGTGLEILWRHQRRHLLQAERIERTATFPRKN